MSNRIALLLLVLTLSPLARAEEYLTEEQALALAFEKPAAVKRFETPNKEPMAADKLKVFVGELKGGAGRGAAFIDEVIGKHQPITYMVVVNGDGEVRRVEILEYRETYGGQVREESWRKQFQGKKPDSPPEHGEDVKNIAGATLSCKHVTAGVAKILKIFEEKKAEFLR